VRANTEAKYLRLNNEGIMEKVEKRKGNEFISAKLFG
jgi:hypothetical protein